MKRGYFVPYASIKPLGKETKMTGPEDPEGQVRNRFYEVFGDGGNEHYLQQLIDGLPSRGLNQVMLDIAEAEQNKHKERSGRPDLRPDIVTI
jgi:hypothetical protein